MNQKYIIITLTILLACFIALFVIKTKNSESPNNTVFISSPDSSYRFEILMIDSQPYYKVSYLNSIIIDKSKLGLKYEINNAYCNKLKIVNTVNSYSDSIWTPVYGEKSVYPDKYNQMDIQFEAIDSDIPTFNIKARAYNEGIAFRYDFKDSNNIKIHY